MASCFYCRRKMCDDDPYLRETRDHYMPRSQVGGIENNTVYACFACNQVKGDMHPDFFKIVMRDIPEWWRLAEMRGPRGRRLVAAMIECGFVFDRHNNGEPYEEWWLWTKRA